MAGIPIIQQKEFALETQKETSVVRQTRFGYGLGVSFALVIVWILFSSLASIPNNQAIAWIPVLSFIAGIVRVWYPNLDGAITYSSGFLLITLIAYCIDLGLSAGWYHALAGLAAHHLGNLLLAGAQKRKRS